LAQQLEAGAAAGGRVNWAKSLTTTIANWLVVGPAPTKIRDPQNSERGSSTAGVCVNEQAALGMSSFTACLRLVASTIGVLPCPVRRRGKDDLATEARDSGLWRVLNESPNADQTPVDYFEGVVISLLMRGNHYARKLKEGTRLLGLEPVRPDIVQVRRQPNGALRYQWALEGASYDLGEEDVFHIRGFGGGPVSGLGVMGLARESLGIAIAADRAAGSMFANGVRPSGALKFDKWLDDKKRKDERELIESHFVGAMNTGRPFILEGGMTWEQISLSADDAQLLQSRAWSVEEVCRWFGVPPVLIGHSKDTTAWGTGIEQLMLGFVKFTLMPYLRRIELAIGKQLLTPAERAQGLFAQFNLEGLLRGDSAARARFYETMTRIGVMSRNECRRKENLPPVDGGDEILVQSQYVPLTEAIAQAIANSQS
jgi:HK97 family phage portal protein